jgi:hypothetical protein
LAGQATAPGTPSSKSAQAGAEKAVRDARGAPAQPAHVQRDDIGFSSTLPADWQFITATSGPRAVVPYPAAAPPRKGDACIDMAMTASKSSSASVAVVLALPFKCYGQTMAASDLQNFGLGAAAGLKQAFAIVSQAQGNYFLGNHPVWIERADGTALDRPENPYTFEIACTVLTKGAACWITMAADAASLHDFEQQAVILEGEKFNALVPAADAPVVPTPAPKKPS